MLIRANKKRDILTALALGACALFLNLFSSNAFDQSQIAWGNVFLFASALALGLPGALVACAVGVIPLSLAAGQHFEGIRLLLLFSVVGVASERASRVPGFLVCLVLWLAFFIPGFFVMNWMGVTEFVPSAAEIFSACLHEVLLALTAGTILLNSTLWSWLANRPRHVPLSSLLMHSLTFVSTTTILFILNSFSSNGTAQSPLIAEAGTIMLLVWLCLSVIVPAYAGWRVGEIIVNNFQRFFHANLSPNTMAGNFSGLSSDYWRRHSAPKAEADRAFSKRDTQSEPAENTVYQKIGRAGLAIIAINRNGTISFVNQKFRTLMQINNNQMIGKNIDALGIKPEISKHIMQLAEATFRAGPRITELKLNELASNNLRFYELASHYSDAYQASPISDGPDSVIITLKDITDRRSVELHLLQAQKLSSLGTMISNIAQTFSNSLTTIAGHASIAKNCKTKDEAQTSLQHIIQAASKAGDVVKKLLDYTEGKPSSMKVENLGQVLDERLELAQRMVGADWQIEFEANKTDLGVICDPNLLLQALTNLLLNAKESYLGNPGKIKLILDTETIDEDVAYLHIGAQPGQFARLRVQDWGQGMSRETLARAFDPLFTTKSSEGHSGLGLSIVYAIVRAHDGFLTAESPPEKGTTVSIYLPLKEFKVEKAGMAKESTHSPSNTAAETFVGDNSKSKASILVVEDEPEIRDLIAKMLDTLGYQVTSCANGSEALERTKQSKFNLFLVDMVMPKMNGLELISRLQSLYPNTRTLIMTGYGITPGKSELGCDVIPKPFSLEDLSKAVKEALTAGTDATKGKNTGQLSL